MQQNFGVNAPVGALDAHMIQIGTSITLALQTCTLVSQKTCDMSCYSDSENAKETTIVHLHYCKNKVLQDNNHKLSDHNPRILRKIQKTSPAQ